MRWALITGASSGIGREIASVLYLKNYSVILTGRNSEALFSVKKELERDDRCAKILILPADLSNRRDCFRIYQRVKPYDIGFLVNCAGFGVYGPFLQTDLASELSEIDVNVTAVHILTKLFLRDMVRKDEGHILNVASSAGFMAGPYFSSYYASKNYVTRLSEAIYEELRRQGSHVKVTALCPGPVATDFDRRAGVKNSMKGLDPRQVAEYGVRAAEKGSMLAVPGLGMKLGLVLGRLLGDHLLTRITGSIQKKKGGKTFP